VDLFEFNDDFIASAACGMNDEDVLEVFAESIRAGADVLERQLSRIAGADLVSRARFVDGAFEIPLTQDQFDAEFGNENEPPKATVRRAIISATIPGSQAMTKALNGD
jgi:hypothetical protein